MKKALALSLALLLLLSSGCAPDRETGASPVPTPTGAPTSVTPAPTPSPAPEPVDFRAFLAEVNGQRRAELARPLPDLAPYTPDYPGEIGTFTAAETDALLSPREGAAVTEEEAREDIRIFFRLLKTTYGAYHYFGGDEVFLPAMEEALSKVPEGECWSWQLGKLLAEAVKPLITDGHFRVGSEMPIVDSVQAMYYVPDLYFDDPTGLDRDYVKPTIGPDGAITYCFAALSHDGAGLPASLGGTALSWVRAAPDPGGETGIFKEMEQDGVPIMVSRAMAAGQKDEKGQAQLARLSSCGGEYADKPVFVVDLRCNGGGYSTYGMEWFRGFTGHYPDAPRTLASKYGDLARELSRRYAALHPDDPYRQALPEPGQWRRTENQGTWNGREGVAIVLMDGGTASAGEEMVTNLRTVENTLFVGTNTGGCFLVPSNNTYYLPRSGIPVFFGRSLGLDAGGENRDGVGYLPDLWVEPARALDAAVRMVQYYGLQ